MSKTIFHQRDKVLVRISGAILKFGDIAIIHNVDFTRKGDDFYYLFDKLRNIGEWFCERHFDKHIERPPKKIVYSKIEKFAKEIKEEPQKPFERIKGVYTNLPSNYGIYDELKKQND